MYPLGAIALSAGHLCQDYVLDSPHGGDWKCVPFGAAFWDTSPLVPTAPASDSPIPCPLSRSYVVLEDDLFPMHNSQMVTPVALLKIA